MNNKKINELKKELDKQIRENPATIKKLKALEYF